MIMKIEITKNDLQVFWNVFSVLFITSISISYLLYTPQFPKTPKTKVLHTDWMVIIKGDTCKLNSSSINSEWDFTQGTDTIKFKPIQQ